MDWLNQLGAFLLGGGLIGLLDIFLRWRANKDLAKQSDVSRAFVLIDQLQEDNERLRNRLREFEGKNDERERELLAVRSESASLRIGVLVLIGQLEEMGVKPKWTPEKTVRVQDVVAVEKPG